MNILLDFDGVLNTTPSWRAVDTLADDFMAFHPKCAKNLEHIINYASKQFKSPINIVLTTTHRIHYDSERWQAIFAYRGINVQSEQINKVNNANSFSELGNRCQEVMAWIKCHPQVPFIILDDDKSLHDLPIEYKNKWVETSFLIGLNDEKMKTVLQIVDTIKDE